MDDDVPRPLGVHLEASTENECKSNVTKVPSSNTNQKQGEIKPGNEQLGVEALVWRPELSTGPTDTSKCTFPFTSPSKFETNPRVGGFQSLDFIQTFTEYCISYKVMTLTYPVPTLAWSPVQGAPTSHPTQGCPNQRVSDPDYFCIKQQIWFTSFVSQLGGGKSLSGTSAHSLHVRNI